MSNPRRAEIWLVNLDPICGHEQADTRPCLIVSNNRINACAANMFIGIPLTSKFKNMLLHIKIPAGACGLKHDSFVMPEHIRALSTQRCIKLMGLATPEIMQEVEQKIKIALDLA